MAPDPTIQQRVYRALKADLRSGFLLPGDPAEILALSRRYGSSETPVREAGWRGVGERLLEPAPHGGFRVCPLTPTGLRHLYQWNSHHLASAVALAEPVVLIDRIVEISVPPQDGQADVVQATAILFDAISAATGNAEFVAASDRLNDRLSAVRLVEHQAVRDTPAELATLLRLGVSEHPNGLRKALLHYHRRRIERADMIVGMFGELRRDP